MLRERDQLARGRVRRRNRKSAAKELVARLFRRCPHQELKLRTRLHLGAQAHGGQAFAEISISGRRDVRQGGSTAALLRGDSRLGCGIF